MLDDAADAEVMVEDAHGVAYLLPCGGVVVEDHIVRPLEGAPERKIKGSRPLKLLYSMP